MNGVSVITTRGTAASATALCNIGIRGRTFIMTTWHNNIKYQVVPDLFPIRSLVTTHSFVYRIVKCYQLVFMTMGVDWLVISGACLQTPEILISWPEIREPFGFLRNLKDFTNQIVSWTEERQMEKGKGKTFKHVDV